LRRLLTVSGTILALFESPFWLERLQGERPELLLERIVAD